MLNAEGNACGEVENHSGEQIENLMEMVAKLQQYLPPIKPYLVHVHARLHLLHELKCFS